MKPQKTMREAVIVYAEENDGRLPPAVEETIAVYLLGGALVDARGELWQSGLRFNYVGARGGWTVEDMNDG